MPVIRAFLLTLVAIMGSIHAQSDSFIRTPQQIVAMTPNEVEDYLEAALAEKLPPSSVDSLVILAASRETLVLPKLVQRFHAALQHSEETNEVRTKLGGLLAYLGTSASMDALLQVTEAYPAMTVLLPQSLSYSSGRGNAFELAYLVMEKGRDSETKVVLEWVRENVPKGRNYENWARVLLARHSNRYVLDVDVENDPIASRLDESARTTLRQKVYTEYVKRHQDK